MKAQTDLEGVKATAKMLLMTEIHENEFSPAIVQHPFTSTGLVLLSKHGGMHFADITKSREYLELWQNNMQKEIDAKQSALEVYMLLNKPYRLTFLKFEQPYLSQKDFSIILSDAWISSENPNMHPDLTRRELIAMFKAADAKELMSQDEQERRTCTETMKKTMKLEIANENFEHDGYFYADIALPAKDYEIKDAYHRARIPHHNGYSEITVNECQILPELEHMRLDTPTMAEMNFLAKRLAALSEDERIVLQAVKGKVFDGKEGQLISIKDVINLTYGLNNVPIIFSAGTDEELGDFVIENELNEAVSAVDYDSRDLLDKAKIGKTFRESEGGVFVGKKYVVAGDYELPQIYDGKSLPESEPSTDWVFRLEIAKQPIDDPSETEDSAEWLALPVKKSVADRMAERFDAERIEDCVYFGFESTIPQIEAEHFGDMQDFDKLNTLAQEIKQMSDLDQMHFKAVLTAQEPSSLDEISDIAKNLRSYQYAPYLENSSEYFVSYISRFLKKPFDISWLQSQNFHNEGEELCERLGVTQTPYGYVAGHWQSLYEYVARHHSQPRAKRMAGLGTVR